MSDLMQDLVSWAQIARACAGCEMEDVRLCRRAICEIDRLRKELRIARRRIKRGQVTKGDFDAETERLVMGGNAETTGDGR